MCFKFVKIKMSRLLYFVNLFFMCNVFILFKLLNLKSKNRKKKMK